MRKLIIEHGVRYFGVGGAIGYDTLAAKALFQIKEREFPHIKIILVYPFEQFTARWSPIQKAEYKKLFPKYDKCVCICKEPNREAYLSRDRHLIDNSAYCIAYCVRNFGGSAYTVKYAMQKGVQIRNIAHK
ncbi:MAG: DUF1273 family protein [Oscillospiraceae bacterium]|nr:DUF1273 family protein [Oscillospiraceae bacterium]